MKSIQRSHWWPTVRPAVVIGVGVSMLVAVVSWGGTARPGPLFVAGVALALGALVMFGLLGYWLYLSPMPERAATLPMLSPERRRLLALFLPIAGLLFTAGSIWDEAWHLRFGGFGDDFLWAPHLLIYSSLAIIALFALGSVALLARGDLRARFRSEPQIGIICLASALLVVSLPADQMWHIIYGVDLTAWSLPHVWIVAGMSLVMYSSIALVLSFVPRSPWRGLVGIQGFELLVFSLLMTAAIAVLQVGVTEWAEVREIPLQATGNNFRDAFWSRPEPLYPVVVTIIALFCGNLALHVTRRVGAATLLALLVALCRTGSALALAQFDGAVVAVQPFWLLLPAAVALDLWYATRLPQAAHPRTLLLGSIIGSLASLAVVLPLISLSMVYPRVNAATLPWMLIWSLLMGVIGGWAGAKLGEWLASRERVAAEARSIPARTRWIAAATGALALAYTLIVALTATPPVV
ncbi:MAG: hypothetical protein H7Z42_13080 [Roseiflexaceae bacterium]|nr:hypothetical protein [Roseiflexaceae bacterium]